MRGLETCGRLFSLRMEVEDVPFWAANKGQSLSSMAGSNLGPVDPDKVQLIWVLIHAVSSSTITLPSCRNTWLMPPSSRASAGPGARL